MRTKILTLITAVSIARDQRLSVPRPPRARVSIATTPSFASPSRRTPRGAAPSEIDLMYELTYNLFALPGYKPSGVPRAERQHDRRSARLELVHQPHRHEAAHHRRTRPRPRSSAPRRIRRAG